MIITVIKTYHTILTVLIYDEMYVSKFGGFIIRLMLHFVPPTYDRIMRVMHASRTSCVKDFDPSIVLLRLRCDRSRLNAKTCRRKK